VRRVEVAAFRMERYPVTVFEYARFIADGGYKKAEFWAQGGHGQFPEPGSWQRQLQHPSRPVVEVSWYEAAAYCRWAGGRLPSEAEWECAARCGREGVRYPWGNEEPDPARANYDMNVGQPTPVGLYPDGATPGGIQDLAGNVLEWVFDWYEEGKRRVLRGGSWSSNPRRLRVSNRSRVGPFGRYDYVGFRCVRE